MEWASLNDSKKSEILSNVFRFVRNSSEDSVTALMDALKQGITSNSQLKRTTNLSGPQLERLAMLITDFGNDTNSFLLCIQTAHELQQQLSKEVEDIDLTYTGPVQFSVTGRSTSSVIMEMIEKAHRKITIIGYQITKDAKQIVEQLSKCIEGGVEIILVIDTAEGKNLDVIDNLWRGLKRPKIYTRQRGKKDVYYKIHAKTITVDSDDLLVTSANLTWHGMNKNLEMGIRVKGPMMAKKVENLVQELIESGYLMEVK